MLNVQYLLILHRSCTLGALGRRLSPAKTKHRKSQDKQKYENQTKNQTKNHRRNASRTYSNRYQDVFIRHSMREEDPSNIKKKKWKEVQQTHEKSQQPGNLPGGDNLAYEQKTGERKERVKKSNSRGGAWRGCLSEHNKPYPQKVRSEQKRKEGKKTEMTKKRQHLIYAM